MTSLLRSLWALCTLLASCHAITTTLNGDQQSSAAFLADQTFLEAVILDIQSRNQLYTSYAAAHSMNYPESLLQFYVFLEEDTHSEFPTSLFVHSFPYNDLQSFITSFPWYSSLLSEAGASSFYLPEQYATAIITAEGSVTTILPAAVVPSTSVEGVVSTRSSSVSAVSSSDSSSSISSSSVSSSISSSHSSSHSASSSVSSSSSAFASSTATSSTNAAIMLSIPGVAIPLLACFLF